MEWILYYIIGIIISLIITTLIAKIDGVDYDGETSGLIICSSIIFPITIVIAMFICIYFLIDKFIKLILK